MCSVKKVVLKNFAKFTGKHQCQSLFFNKVAALRPDNPRRLLLMIALAFKYYIRRFKKVIKMLLIFVSLRQKLQIRSCFLRYAVIPVEQYVTHCNGMLRNCYSASKF